MNCHLLNGGKQKVTEYIFLTFFYSNINNAAERYKLLVVRKAFVQSITLQVRTLSALLNAVSFNYLQTSQSTSFPY